MATMTGSFAADEEILSGYKQSFLDALAAFDRAQKVHEAAAERRNEVVAAEQAKVAATVDAMGAAAAAVQVAYDQEQAALADHSRKARTLHTAAMALTDQPSQENPDA